MSLHVLDCGMQCHSCHACYAWPSRGLDIQVEHPHYGARRPEAMWSFLRSSDGQDLGVGCARHWLVRLAAALELQYAWAL